MLGDVLKETGILDSINNNKRVSNNDADEQTL